MLAYVLLRLTRLWADEQLERRAVGVFRFIAPQLPHAPSAFGHALCALDLYFSPRRELAVIGPPDADVARRELARFDPNAVVAFGPSDEVPLLSGKGYVDGPCAVPFWDTSASQASVTKVRRQSGSV